MLTAIPLTVVPLIIFNLIAHTAGAAHWADKAFDLPLISGYCAVSYGDLLVLVGLVMLFFETLRSAAPARTAMIANHIVSTVLLIVYVVQFLADPQAGDSLYLILTAIALFDVIAGFTISIRTAQRDITYAGDPAITHH
ncbi:MAG TPA: hypothetical protein VHA70_01695 [Bauldia sp.]|nr:hypothetical protein [Bauldia sp.]HVZ13121.1 hypothetical protein [Bauldia sp.]